MNTISDPIRVLHVDDEPDFADIAGTFLERADDRLEVETADNVSDGLDYLVEADFDCVVSDYDMPGQNGIEFLETVREEYPDLPFILYTGKGSEEVASDAISAGVTDYLQKESGTSQYTVLANRISNAVDQYRTNQRAAELDRIRTLVSDINQAIVRAESPTEVKTRVCEIISESDPYLFAWVGEIDPDTNRVEPQVSAGVEQGYLDEITITTDESPTGQGPGGTAVRERRVAISQNIAEDPEFEPWRADALDRGYRSVAAVPLGYHDTLYGELVVYAERPHAFDETERDLLVELGGDIGHVLHSFDVRADLSEERDFIEQALNSLTDIFYVFNADGTLRRWNEQLVDVTGYTDEEIAEMRATELFPADEQQRIAEAIEETLTIGKTTVESEFLTADGDRVPYEFTGSRLTDLDDNLIGLIGIGRDLTERKQREQQLERLIDTLPGMVYRCRNESGWPMEHLRGSVRDVTGYHASELESREGLYGEQVIHPDDREEVWTTVQEALEACESFEITYRIRTKDEEIRWVWERGRGIYADDGDVEALEGFITDITEREQHKRAISTLHKTAQSVMQADTAEEVAEVTSDAVRDIIHMPANGVHLYDEGEDGLVPVAWTSQTEEIVGEPPTFAPGEGLAGKAFQTGQPQIYDDISTVPDRFNPETPVRSQIIFPVDDHGVLVIGSPEPDAFDDVDVSLADIVATHTTTALNRIEHARELERQNERLEEFVGIVSHDLRNPLNVAEGRLELAREECDSEHLDGVAKAHERMRILIDDLLALAREGEEMAEPEPVNLSDLIESCWQNVETAEATLVADTDWTIRADRSRLAQLLENLIRNAVEHGSEDVTITIGELDDGFYIADDGPGIPEDEREQIFDSGYTTSDEGAGFGLAIVREIVEAHDWDIHVTESEAGGARFEITGVGVAAE